MEHFEQVAEAVLDDPVIDEEFAGGMGPIDAECFPVEADLVRELYLDAFGLELRVFFSIGSLLEDGGHDDVNGFALVCQFDGLLEHARGAAGLGVWGWLGHGWKERRFETPRRKGRQGARSYRK